MTIQINAGVEADIRRRSETMQGVFLFAAIALLATVAARYVVWSLVRVAGAARDRDPLPEVLADIGVNLVDALPALLLLTGVVAAYRVFGRMSTGEIFSGRNARSIASMGESMIWAAIASILISPTIIGWIRRDTTIDVNLEDWALVIGVLGWALLLIGRVFALATRIKADNDAMV